MQCEAYSQWALERDILHRLLRGQSSTVAEDRHRWSWLSCSHQWCTQPPCVSVCVCGGGGGGGGGGNNITIHKQGMLEWTHINQPEDVTDILSRLHCTTERPHV